MYAAFTVIFRLWFPRLKNMIVGSRLLEKHFATTVANIIRIPASLDVKATSFEDRSPHDRLVLAYAGAPGPKDQLLESVPFGLAALTPAERSRVELRLIGITMEEFAKSLGSSARLLDELKGQVTALGRVPRDRVLEELKHAHFTMLLRPNARYANAGFPSKVPESLAVGVPVMLNFTSDLEEYLGDRTACIPLRDNSAEAVTAAVRAALAFSPDDMAALRRGARSKAEQYFDYRCFIEAFRLLLSRAG